MKNDELYSTMGYIKKKNPVIKKSYTIVIFYHTQADVKSGKKN